MGYIGSDPKTNESVSTAQLVDDSVTNAKIVDNVLFTSVTSSVVSASSTITADTFTGTFSGALSSSAQIATSISGSSTSLSSSLATRTTTLESASGSFSTRVTTIEGSGTTQGVGTSDSPTFNNITATGTVTAQEFHSEFVSASITFTSGSHKFGDTTDDIHQMTGSLRITGSGNHYFTDGNVGIGTASPDAPLTVKSSGQSTVIQSYIKSSDSNHLIEFEEGGSSQGIIEVKSAAGGTAKIRLDGAGDTWFDGGNVGIGTTSPSVALHTVGQVRADRASNQFALHDASGTALASLQANVSGVTGGALIFKPKNTAGSYTERVRIDESGNVGIGTSTIPARLTVDSGSIQTAWSLSATNQHIQLANNANTVYGMIGLMVSSANLFIGTDNDNQLIVLDRSTGKVGIGTASPDTPLEVSVAGSGVTNVLKLTTTGSGTVPALQFEGDASGTQHIISRIFAQQDDATNGGIVFETENSGTVAERMRIDSSGHVGIGATTPNEQANTAAGPVFSVEGSDGDVFDPSTHATWGPVINIHNDNNTIGANSVLAFTSRTASKGYSGIAGTGQGADKNDLRFFVRNGGSIFEAMRIDPAGKVGIGATSNLYGKLQVNQSANNDESGIGILDSTNGRSMRLWCDSTTAYINSGDGGGQKLILNQGAGDVGIGTTSPYYKVDIFSNENVPLRIHRPNNSNLNSAGAHGIGFSTRSDGAATTSDTRSGIFSYYNGNLFFATHTSDIIADPDAYGRMWIKADGNVGIGTAATGNHKLYISANTADYALRIDNDGNASNRQGIQIRIGQDTNPTSNYFYMEDGNGTNVGEIVGDGAGGVTYSTSSDQRLKTNIVDMESGLNIISQLKPRNYEMISKPDEVRYGLIAQELLEVFPQAVTNVDADVDKKEYMGIGYDKLVPILIKAVQELTARIEALES